MSLSKQTFLILGVIGCQLVWLACYQVVDVWSRPDIMRRSADANRVTDGLAAAAASLVADRSLING
jgi:hypothetical protein